MTDEQLAQWLKVLADEQRRQTSALEDMRWMTLAIFVVFVISGVLSILNGFLVSGLVR